jgi:hypothetical protein
MSDFLADNALAGFWFLPPDGSQDVYVVCDEWASNLSDKNNVSGIIGSLGVSFRQIFNKGQGVYIDPLAQAWYDAVIAAGGLVSNNWLARINDFVLELRTFNLLRYLDRLYPYYAENVTQALTCIVSAKISTAVNSPVFTPKKNIQFDGLSSYIDTGFNPMVDTANNKYQLNSGMFGVWVETAQSSGRYMMGNNRATNYSGTSIQMISTANNSTTVDSSTATVSFANNKRTGMYTAMRRDGANCLTFFDNALMNSQAQISTNLYNNTFKVGGSWSGGILQQPAAFGASLAYIGSAMSDLDLANLYNAFNRYLYSTVA